MQEDSWITSDGIIIYMQFIFISESTKSGLGQVGKVYAVIKENMTQLIFDFTIRGMKETCAQHCTIASKINVTPKGVRYCQNNCS